MLQHSQRSGAPSQASRNIDDPNAPTSNQTNGRVASIGNNVLELVVGFALKVVREGQLGGGEVFDALLFATNQRARDT
jgi:hypothetical protein